MKRKTEEKAKDLALWRTRAYSPKRRTKSRKGKIARRFFTPIENLSRALEGKARENWVDEGTTLAGVGDFPSLFARESPSLARVRAFVEPACGAPSSAR